MLNPSLKTRPLITGRMTLAAAISLLSTGHAWAQSAQPIEEVQVWGTEVKASSIDLGEEAIAIRQADHLSDLLRFIPGVDVGGAHSLNQRITVRSLDDKDLRVSIDGAVQNTYMFHHMGNLQIHSDILKSADIDVGNNSVVNGGLGGASRFETRSAQDLLKSNQRWGARLNATVGNNSSTNLSASGYGQITDSIDVLGYLNSVDRVNYTVGGGEIKDSQGNIIEGTDGKVRGLEGELLDALVKVGFNAGDNQRFKIGYEAYTDEGDYSARPDMGLATDIAIAGGDPVLLPTKFTRDTLTLNYDGNWGNSVVDVNAFSNTSTLKRDELGLGRDSDLFIQTGESENTGINVIANYAIKNTHQGMSHNITYGLDYIRFKTQYQSFDQNSTTLNHAGEQAETRAIFIQDEIAITPQLSATPGVRYETWDIDSNLTNNNYSEPTLALDITYALDETVQLKASATQLFKGPELSEVFTGAGNGDVFNNDIKAETGVNTEFGITHQGSQFSAGFTGYETVINDYIYDYINYTLFDAPFPKDNIGDLRLRGMEAFWGYSLDNLDLLFTYATVNSKLSAHEQYREMPYAHVNRDSSPVLDATGNQIIENQEGFEGARTDRTQGDTFSLTLDYFIAPADLQLHYDIIHTSNLAAGKDLDGATLDNAKDGSTVHNLSVRWTPQDFAQGLALTFGIDNVFDEYYASQASRTGVSFHPVFGELFLTDYEPGRNIKGSVSYQF